MLYGDISLFATVEFQMTLLLLVAIGGYLIASWVHQSAVVGEIVLGLVVGPSVLGLITYTDLVEIFAQIGVIIMLFVIGFDFHFKDLLNSRYVAIALSGVVIPWVSGFIFAVTWGMNPINAMFVGTALTATSVAITANVLKEMGKLHTGAANAIIGTAVIDDILSLIALSITTEIISDSFTIGWLIWTILKPVLFIVIAGLIGIYIVDRMLIVIDRTAFAVRFPEFVFLCGLMTAFVYALAAEIVGVSGLVGAFIAGVSLSRVGLVHSKSIKKGSEYLYVPMAAIFFISLGILVDLHRVTEEILIFTLFLTIIAIISKFVGCGISARLVGMTSRDSLIVGAGMIPRGEMTMIVALFAVSIGIAEQELYIAVLLMSLLSTCITPVLFHEWLYRKTTHEPALQDREGHFLHHHP
ncbi:MAG: cation:proton antiporter [Methanospirillaceae archaeon]|nr:cation:proton antiporter [Methanospirillaceae archaeon]